MQQPASNFEKNDHPYWSSLCLMEVVLAWTMALLPSLSVLLVLIGLVGFPVPTINYRLINCLSALPKSTDIVHPLWQAIETAQLIGTTSDRTGVHSGRVSLDKVVFISSQHVNRYKNTWGWNQRPRVPALGVRDRAFELEH